MLRYRTPGVYFETLDEPSLEATRTDVAGFVGFARRGPLHSPQRIESWAQFLSVFGGHSPKAYLAAAAQGFFANGGRTCYVVRVADPDLAACASLGLLDPTLQPILWLTALNEGEWGTDITASIRLTGDQRFTLRLELTDEATETWRDLTWGDPDSPRDALRLLNGWPLGGVSGPASRLVRACEPRIAYDALDRRACPSRDKPMDAPRTALSLTGADRIGRLTGGIDGLRTVRPEHLSGDGAPPDKVWGLAALEQIPEVAIVAMPDIMRAPYDPEPLPKSQPATCDRPAAPPQPRPKSRFGPDWPPAFDPDERRALQFSLVGHCERLKNRVAILDMDESAMATEAAQGWRTGFDTKYAALYYPWLRMPDPLPSGELLRPVPPSGHVAGIYARVETEIGVHKPPANEVVMAADDVTVTVDDITHGVLNDSQVNVIRAYPGRGLRVAGARTLSSDSLWHFVNVRRLLIMIERTIEARTQWIVFEPNNRDLWGDVSRVTRAFLTSLWQRGMLDGVTANDAFDVICDEHSTPPEELDAGRLITVIGVQPPLPAEFVVIRIGKTEAGTEVLEGSRA